jgi:hypothetical protein
MASAVPRLPTQICTWMHANFLAGDSDDRGQFLYALKDTQPRDRQVVWEGGSERGIVAVVDFAVPVVRVAGIYYAWGTTTMLTNPVDHDAIHRVELLEERFFGRGRYSLHGRAKRLQPRIAEAIDGLAGGLPPPRTPRGDPRDAPTDRWFGSLNIDPESVFETAVLASPRLWRKIGFPSAPAPQQRISARDRPDLLAPGVVGEVKRRCIPKDIGQLVRYLDELEESQPRSSGWRGVLIHAGELSPAVAARADQSPRSTQIEIWRLEPARLRAYKAVRQR